MFDDDAWLGDVAPGPLGRGHSQARSYRAWEAEVKAALKEDRRKRLVILEAGCGLRVPTARQRVDSRPGQAAQAGRAGRPLARIGQPPPSSDTEFSIEFAFRCKLWPARLAGDEREPDRDLHSRPALVSKNKLVPFSALQRKGFSSTALAESNDRGS